MITKFCHNEECKYVCTANPDTDVYADSDVACPACGISKSLKSKMPEFMVVHLVSSWWKEHRL